MSARPKFDMLINGGGRSGEIQIALAEKSPHMPISKHYVPTPQEIAGRNMPEVLALICDDAHDGSDDDHAAMFAYVMDYVPLLLSVNETIHVPMVPGRREFSCDVTMRHWCFGDDQLSEELREDELQLADAVLEGDKDRVFEIMKHAVTRCIVGAAHELADTDIDFESEDE